MKNHIRKTISSLYARLGKDLGTKDNDELINILKDQMGAQDIDILKREYWRKQLAEYDHDAHDLINKSIAQADWIGDVSDLPFNFRDGRRHLGKFLDLPLATDYYMQQQAAFNKRMETEARRLNKIAEVLEVYRADPSRYQSFASCAIAIHKDNDTNAA